MRWSLALVRALAVLALWIGRDSANGSESWCPCLPRDLCQPIPADHQFQVEPHTMVQVMIFDNGGTDWKQYDWSKVTTVVAIGKYDRELLCHAHANHVRVVLKAIIRLRNLIDSNKRAVWINGKMRLAKRQFMDGINMEMWENVTPGSENFHALSQLVKEAANIFHREIPGSQVTFNVPWSPDCIVGRCYEYVAFANSCDFLFVMSYNMHRRMLDDCFAKPNAPYHQTLSGLSAYINLGIDSRNLVMGVPWFGYDYTCKHFFEVGRCELTMFHVSKPTCSFRAGRWVPYKEVMKQLPRSITGRYWDDDHKAPYYSYMVNNTYHEVWYDDPESISLKSSILKKLKLRGIGVWLGNFLNYRDNPTAAMQTEKMWDALSPF
ncbi:di-N-acetylchitobiase-like [Heterodontus francisci]|uniref:di-N-acetylchitobiase-like n=1 Tax=Heterodontus francisci TaxID=7792 RepID=UPI00355C7157